MLFNGEAGLVQSLTDSTVSILFSSKDACDSCGLKVVCAPGKESERQLTLPHSGTFTIGQKVRVEERSNLELHLAFIQFGLPMVTFLAGLLVGYFIPTHGFLPRELIAFLVGCLGLVGSFFAARHLVSRIVDLIPEKYLRIVACD